MTPDLHDELRSALGQADAADFDYDALVAGTKARAARILRRRAVSRGIAAVVLAPTLVAAGWFVGNNLGGSKDGERNSAERLHVDHLESEMKDGSIKDQENEWDRSVESER